MRTLTKVWTLSLLASLVLATVARGAEGTLRYTSRPGGHVSIDGDSSIHKWTVQGAIISGYFEVEPAFETDKSLKSVAGLHGQSPAATAQIAIPIRSLHNSGGHEKMDEVMQEAMHADQYPMIRYKLTSITVKDPVPDSGSPVKFDTKGELSMSGVTNEIEMEITMERLDNNQLKFSGSKELKMSAFKILAPHLNLVVGEIKTDDLVKVGFEWRVGLRKTQ